MKPLIGITASMEKEEKSHSVNDINVQAIVRAGGIPVLLPNIQTDDDIAHLANQIDGLYATGGYDVDPLLFGEEPHPELGTVTPTRDHFELAITKKILEQNKPFLGVCRGAQILNIATGGAIYQDIFAQADGNLLQHSQKSESKYGSHYVQVEQGSLLYKLTQEERLTVNSFHHQACSKVVAPMVVSATSSDDIIEAIESKDHDFVLGVQWHPETMAVVDDQPSLAIYESFITACIK